MSGLRARRTAGTALALVGALGVVGASFLPWVRSGSAHRTSDDAVEAAERLDVVSGTAARAVRAWFLVPLVVAGTCLAASLADATWVPGAGGPPPLRRA